jgi:Ca2+-binding EF-hand superfamily protein
MGRGHNVRSRQSKSSVKKLQALFETIDADHSGKLDEKELTAFLGQSGDGTELAPLIIRIFDSDRDGHVTFEEFVEFIDLSVKMDQEPLAVYRALFNAMDSDHSGELNADELIEFARFVGIQVTQAESAQMLAAVDRSGDGR